MERFPYIPPTTKSLLLQLDTVLCVLTTSPDPYEENGDYEWDYGDDFLPTP